MEKMVQIAQKVEEKEDQKRSYSDDAGEKNFLCNRERELLFQYGPSYDTSQDLDLSKDQVNKSLEKIQRQMERDREHQKEMDLGL